MGIASLLLALGFLHALPAPRSPVHWQTGPAHSVRPGAKFDFTITGRIDPGWHLYALEEPEGGPIATEVSLTEGDVADLLRVTESKPRTVLDKASGKPTPLFDSTVAFTLHMRLPSSIQTGPYTLHVMLRFQSCDEHGCLPPHTDTLEIPLKVSR